jgi:hypothetical protein
VLRFILSSSNIQLMEETFKTAPEDTKYHQKFEGCYRSFGKVFLMLASWLIIWPCGVVVLSTCSKQVKATFTDVITGD